MLPAGTMVPVLQSAPVQNPDLQGLDEAGLEREIDRLKIDSARRAEASAVATSIAAAVV